MTAPTSPSLSPLSIAVLAAIPESGCPCAYPRDPSGPTVDGSAKHMCSDIPSDLLFQVRGATYLSDKTKVTGTTPLFDFMHHEMFRSTDKIGHTATRKGSWLRKARAVGDRRFYLIIAYVTPSAPYIHLTLYFAVNDDSISKAPKPFAELWEKFITPGAEADENRNKRWKVFPRLTADSWIANQALAWAVGSKPALLAGKITHTWISEEGGGGGGAASGGGSNSSSSSSSSSNSSGSGAASKIVPLTASAEESVGKPGGPSLGPYLEGDCDVSSSIIANGTVGTIQSYASGCIIDLGFAIEPLTNDECPEAIVGQVRMTRIHVDDLPIISAAEGDAVLGAVGVTHAGP